jgi:hypothetical protein
MVRSTYGSYGVAFSLLVAALRSRFLLEGLRRAPESRHCPIRLRHVTSQMGATGCRMSANHALLSDAPNAPVPGLVLDATSTDWWTWGVWSDLQRWSPEPYQVHGLGSATRARLSAKRSTWTTGLEWTGTS